MSASTDLLPIGELSRRSGFAPSALRYYEREGLIRADRGTGNHRRYQRGELRRLAFIRAARTIGCDGGRNAFLFERLTDLLNSLVHYLERSRRGRRFSSRIGDVDAHIPRKQVSVVSPVQPERGHGVSDVCTSRFGLAR